MQKPRPLKSIVVALAVAIPAGAIGATAQQRASERGQVTQIVNGTTITVDFSRPSARGRAELFGGVVHWGEMWTPGANYATTLEVDKPIELNGHALGPGKYSVWMQPQPDEWTVYLNPHTRLYHDSPVPDDHMLMFSVRPEQGAHMEALAWYFPVVGGGSAELRMHWGDTYVPLTIMTQAFEIPTVAAAELATYLGSYAIDGIDPTSGGPFRVTIQVLEEEGAIAGRWGRAPIALIQSGAGEFRVGFLRDGSLFDVGDEMTLRVITHNGEGVGMEVLWEGEVFTTGERVR
jgi:hypothetical protein